MPCVLRRSQRPSAAPPRRVGALRARGGSLLERVRASGAPPLFRAVAGCGVAVGSSCGRVRPLVALLKDSAACAAFSFFVACYWLVQDLRSCGGFFCRPAGSPTPAVDGIQRPSAPFVPLSSSIGPCAVDGTSALPFPQLHAICCVSAPSLGCGPSSSAAEVAGSPRPPCPSPWLRSRGGQMRAAPQVRILGAGGHGLRCTSMCRARGAISKASRFEFVGEESANERPPAPSLVRLCAC